MRSLLASALLILAANAASPQISKVFPADGSTVVAVGPVGAELDFTKGEPADPASLRLSVDGDDVTSRSSITSTRDWPPSFLSITYVPATLAQGDHHAEVSFRTDAGKTVTYRWRFVTR